MKTYLVVLVSIFLVLFAIYDIMIWRIDQRIEALSAELDILFEENQKLRKKLEEGPDEESDLIQISDSSAPEVANDILVDESYDQAIDYIAKTVWGEARGLSTTEQAAVIWCILNRVDSELNHMPNDIISVIIQPNQFVGYNPDHPVDESIETLTIDVLERWLLEKEGVEDVGRVLPKDYLFFRGDGKHNAFRQNWESTDIWDWSLPSPYLEVSNEA